MSKKTPFPQTIGGVGIVVIAVMVVLVVVSYPKIDVRIIPNESKTVSYATDFDISINKNDPKSYTEFSNVCFLINNYAESIDSVPIKANNLQFSVYTNADCEDCPVSSSLSELKAQQTVTVCKKMRVAEDLSNLNLETKTSWNSLIISLTSTTKTTCEKISEENNKMNFHCNKT